MGVTMSDNNLAAKQALQLARQFRLAAVAVGDRVFSEWDAMAKKDRARLQSLEITLLNLATDLTTQAVGIALDDGKISLAALDRATESAREALEHIIDAKAMIGITTALIGLAATIPTGNVLGMIAAVKNLDDAVKAAQAPASRPPESNEG